MQSWEDYNKSIGKLVSFVKIKLYLIYTRCFLVYVTMFDNNKVSDNIVQYLKYHGPQTAQALASAFAVTPMAIRQHLYIHNKNELVTFQDIKSARGRPKRLWRLTPKSERLYVDNAAIQFSLFLNALIRQKLITQLKIANLYQETLLSRFVSTAKLIEKNKLHVSLDEILLVLSHEANALGYLFEYEKSGSSNYSVIEHHEPMKKLCDKHDFISEIEMNKYHFILSDSCEVKVMNHILRGHYSSQYYFIKSQ